VISEVIYGVAKANGRNCGVDAARGGGNGGDRCGTDDCGWSFGPSVLRVVNGAAENPLVVNDSLEQRAKIDRREPHYYDETPAAEDRTEEAERPRAPAPRSGTMVK